MLIVLFYLLLLVWIRALLVCLVIVASVMVGWFVGTCLAWVVGCGVLISDLPL